MQPAVPAAGDPFFTPGFCKAASSAGAGAAGACGLQPRIQSPAALSATDNPVLEPAVPEFCFLLHAGEFLVVNFSEAFSTAD